MPDMTQQLAALYELQQTDTALATKEQALRSLDDGKASAAGLAAAQKELAALEQAHRDLEGKLLDKELRLKGTEEERKTKSKQAYGGTIADPKQLSALEKKIAELGRLKGTLEEEILVLMEQVEASAAAVAKQKAAVAKLGEKLAQVKATHESATHTLTGEIDGLRQQRAQLESGIDPALLKQYEAMRAKLDGIAVAAVHLGSCKVCHVTLPSGYATKLKLHNELVKCESCRRILYLAEGASPYKPEEE
jgi:uncharacterized protein